MSRTSGQLQLQCRSFGLPETGTREQLQNTLRDYFVKRDNLDILPQLDIMMAQNAKDSLDYTLDKPWRSQPLMTYWTSHNWVVEPKLDGIRVKAHFNDSYKTNPRLDSRRRSDVNYVYAEKSENFPHLQIDLDTYEDSPLTDEHDGLDDTILDGEMMPPPGVTRIWNGAMWVEGLQIATSIWNSGQETSINLQKECWLPLGPDGMYTDVTKKSNRGCKLHYHAFDIIKYKGDWVCGLPWHERRDILEILITEIRKVNPFYHITPVWYVDRGWCEDGTLEWDDREVGRLGEYEQLIEAGGEGVMFKDINSKYMFGKRSWDWIKLKKFETVDCVVMGSVDATAGKGWEGMIGAFKMGCYQGGELIHVASCSGIDMETRKAASLLGGKLNPEFMGRVAEVRMQVLTTRNYRGRHAVLVRWRPDKNPEECTLDQFKAYPSEMMEHEV